MSGSEQSAEKVSLKLFFRDQQVGIIQFKGERKCSMEYDDAWIQQGFPISPHLEFNQDIHSTSICRFIQNLFPEGSAFERLLETQNLSKYNFYAILKTIGKDTAGALTFIADSPDQETSLRAITTAEIIERLKDESRRNLAFWDGKYRLSVAGVQNKLNVFCNTENQYFLADGQYASTHILKFSNSQFPNIVLNEFFTMRLAKAIHLPVAEVELVSFGDDRALKVERFDRKLTEDTVLKRHMIDGCQALNLPSESKYEQNFGSSKDVAHIREGASLHKLFKFAEQTSVPADSKQKLMDWVLFNLIIGNSDAHGKNISFYLGKNGMTLTPFYDLVSVVFEHQSNAEIDTHLAMAIDDNFDIDQIKTFDLLSLSETVEFSAPLLKRRLERMLGLCAEQLKQLEFTGLDDSENTSLTIYKALIRKRIMYFSNELTQFDEVYASAFKGE